MGWGIRCLRSRSLQRGAVSSHPEGPPTPRNATTCRYWTRAHSSSAPAPPHLTWLLRLQPITLGVLLALVAASVNVAQLLKLLHDPDPNLPRLLQLRAPGSQALRSLLRKLSFGVQDRHGDKTAVLVHGQTHNVHSLPILVRRAGLSDQGGSHLLLRLL